MPPGVPHPVDVHVGSRVRLRRTMLGMSQEKLGEAVGLTFQQIQKYERGANRIGSSRIYQFSRILDVPVSFFFEDMPSEALSAPGVAVRGMSDQKQAPLDDDPMAKRETLELIRAYYRINDPKLRRRVYGLLRSMANLPDED
ncbi:MAG: helix-turn-helix transcriptional regulator [Proteobacteria bacterium]|nr:helix-turn-helix transcriptional regulator [Pseudomonadota bacterium]